MSLQKIVFRRHNWNKETLLLLSTLKCIVLLQVGVILSVWSEDVGETREQYLNIFIKLITCSAKRQKT